MHQTKTNGARARGENENFSGQLNRVQKKWQRVASTSEKSAKPHFYQPRIVCERAAHTRAQTFNLIFKTSLTHIFAIYVWHSVEHDRQLLCAAIEILGVKCIYWAISLLFLRCLSLPPPHIDFHVISGGEQMCIQQAFGKLRDVNGDISKKSANNSMHNDTARRKTTNKCVHAIYHTKHAKESAHFTQRFRCQSTEDLAHAFHTRRR